MAFHPFQPLQRRPQCAANASWILRQSNAHFLPWMLSFRSSQRRNQWSDTMRCLCNTMEGCSILRDACYFLFSSFESLRNNFCGVTGHAGYFVAVWRKRYSVGKLATLRLNSVPVCFASTWDEYKQAMSSVFLR